MFPPVGGKHGYLPAIYGEDAKVFGSLTIAIGLLPLLLFAKNARQAMFIGTVLGTAIVVGIFIWVYG